MQDHIKYVGTVLINHMSYLLVNGIMLKYPKLIKNT